MASRQVAWWPVHLLVAPILESVNAWPLVGTPAWCELAEDDPRKWAAVLDGAQHWALRLETRQQALAQASRDIAAEGEWSSLATRLVRGRGPAYIPRQRRATVR